ncbi:hypothetical protein [Chondromyces apiculatus]|uniref:Uncharacterized protein n=1 Tax=Chondromyces apiculatus DSM 436 TaxID=1192034 RepID=A0A017SXX9_9BACT|nr:hypothetical protein [Chondromyces apiculatus]EYF01470.1 Hypothetical protein CAP_8303 [Chondromyces apiculatus DSM 436]
MLWAIEVAFLVILFFAVGLMALVVMCLPGFAVCVLCTEWVLKVPGGEPFFFTAFGGLFIGTYMVIASVLCGSLSRRPSRAVARLAPQRVGASHPGDRIAVTGYLVDGRSMPPDRCSDPDDWVTDVTCAPTPAEGAAAPPEDDGTIGFPLVIQDADGTLLRIEHWDGTPTPPVPSGVGVWKGFRYRRGAAMFVLGELQRIERAGGYRGEAIAFRLCRGTAAGRNVLSFAVRSGTQADLVRELESDETSPAWALASLALLALGAVSILLAQP